MGCRQLVRVKCDRRGLRIRALETSSGRHHAIAHGAIAIYTLAASTRVFQLKTFARWAKGGLTDAQLLKAAREVMAGRFEADLGGGVRKKRVARAGQGKSGSARTLIAMLHCGGVIFLAGRQKSDPGSDFSDAQVAVARILAKGLQAATEAKVEELLATGAIKEISNEPEAGSKPQG